jgi:aspartyl-tRNA(Asn)/glutamyl-tRNA(Gln) amidotransferase subunit A
LIGEKEDPIAIYLSDMFTALANLAGISAISIPVGLSQQELSLGIQVMGNFF